MSHRAKNFSDTSALIGCGVEGAPARRPARRSAPPVATRLLPDPVGVLRMTLEPETSSTSASSWCGYRVRPCRAAQPTNTSKEASASAGSSSMRVMPQTRC